VKKPNTISIFSMLETYRELTFKRLLKLMVFPVAAEISRSLLICSAQVFQEIIPSWWR